MLRLIENAEGHCAQEEGKNSEVYNWAPLYNEYRYRNIHHKEELFMNLEQIRQHRAKMILQFSIPAIIAMLLTSFITIADGFFIGNYVGKEGIAAVNLGLPIVYLYLGVGLMVSVGGMAIAGMALGAGDRITCNQVFRQTVATAMVFSALISCIMLFCF